MALIVETVTGPTMAAIRAARDAVRDADLVEVRLDSVDHPDGAGAVEGATRPVIVTVRLPQDGGWWTGSEDERRRVLEASAKAGAAYVDLERTTTWRPTLDGTSTRLIVSDHTMDGMPADLESRMAAIRAQHPAIAKIAARVSSVDDLLRLRGLARADSTSDVIIGMGEAGHLTRMVPSRFGSAWTYGGSTAPGQIATARLAHLYRVREVHAGTALYGVAGAPIAHSASPAMHNAAFRAAGLDAVYVPVLAATVEDAARLVRGLGFAGLSITAPLKVGWTAHAGVVTDDEESRALGVVNTVKVGADGVVRARNFDIAGFMGALEARGLEVAGRRVVVLGAGGAASATAWALARAGAEVTVSARRVEEAERVARTHGVSATAWPPEGRWDLVVNTTPVGTWPDVGAAPVDAGLVRAAVAYDLIYNPSETRWLTEAAAEGAQVIGGLDMLVGQASRQFEWWTGQAPDVDVMRAAARAWMAEASR